MARKASRFVSVRFDKPGEPGKRQGVTLGPFYSVGVYPDGMRAYAADHGLPVLATPTQGGWSVNGLPGEVYESFTFFTHGSDEDDV